AGSKICVSSPMLKAKAWRFEPSYGSRASVLSDSGTELHAAKSKIVAKGAAEMRFLLRFDKANIAIHSWVTKLYMQHIATKAECKNYSALYE
ncbi:MAG: hypothetical protein ACPGMT_02280, partial [Candidatus Puniceispirillaceae bacterium]